MKVEIYTLTEEEIERRDYCNALKIKINGSDEFEVYDGYDDNSLSGNFNDCFKIEKLMKLAYQAGKNSEEYTVEYLEVNKI